LLTVPWTIALPDLCPLGSPLKQRLSSTIHDGGCRADV
jgi:hypothetical protein